MLDGNVAAGHENSKILALGVVAFDSAGIGGLSYRAERPGIIGYAGNGNDLVAVGVADSSDGDQIAVFGWDISFVTGVTDVIVGNMVVIVVKSRKLRAIVDALDKHIFGGKAAFNNVVGRRGVGSGGWGGNGYELE